MTFSELNDSSSSFSYVNPFSDQDMDDVTLGKLLTEAHRGQADYCEPEGMSVSQSSLSVVFDGSGILMEKEMSISQLVSRETRTVLTASFLRTPKTEKMVDGSGQPDERDSSSAQIGTLLEKQRHDHRGISRKSRSSRTPSSSCRKRAPNSTRRIMATKSGIS